jgi:hypothetical protein
MLTLLYNNLYWVNRYKKLNLICIANQNLLQTTNHREVQLANQKSFQITSQNPQEIANGKSG